MDFEKMKNRIKSAITNNTIPKLICVFLALIIWFVVMDDKNPVVERVFENVNVELLGVEQVENRGLIIGNVIGQTVDVKVRGKWKSVMRISENDISLTAQIGSVIYSKRVGKVPIDYSINYSEVSITSLSKSSVEIELDEIVSEKKTIEIKSKGELVSGFKLKAIKPQVKEISVKGPSNILKTVAYLQGDVDLSGRKISSNEHVNLQPMDSDGNIVEGVSLEVGFVDTSISINTTKTLDLKVEIKGEVAEKYRFTDAVANLKKIKVTGDSAVLEKLSEIRTKQINIEGRIKSFETNAELSLPETVKVDKNDIINVKVTIQKLETKRFVFKSSDIIIINKINGLNYKFTQSNINYTVEISDIRTVLSNIKKEDLKLKLDVAGLSLGEYKLSIELEGMPKTSTYRVLPEANFNVENEKEE